MIPVQNVYYMLSYAFRVLNEQGYKSIETEEFHNVAELCASILTKGVKQQLKRGLGQEYISETEALPSPRGKIDVTASIKNLSMIRGELVCTYDEFSVNSYMNRIIKSTLLLLLKAKISSSRKKEIKKLYVDTVSNVLASRVDYWAYEIGVEVPIYGVNNAKSKWGVCYPTQNRLYLSYMCAVLPYELIDMTVLHEVCHLKVHGHGQPFWALIKEHMPDLDERKARLREISKTGVNLNLV